MTDLQKEVDRLRAEIAFWQKATSLAEDVITHPSVRTAIEQNTSALLRYKDYWAHVANESLPFTQTPPTPMVGVEQAIESCQCGKGSAGYCDIHKHGWMNTPKAAKESCEHEWVCEKSSDGPWCQKCGMDKPK